MLHPSRSPDAAPLCHTSAIRHAAENALRVGDEIGEFLAVGRAERVDGHQGERPERGSGQPTRLAPRGTLPSSAGPGPAPLNRGACGSQRRRGHKRSAVRTPFAVWYPQRSSAGRDRQPLIAALRRRNRLDFRYASQCDPCRDAHACRSGSARRDAIRDQLPASRWVPSYLPARSR